MHDPGADSPDETPAEIIFHWRKPKTVLVNSLRYTAMPLKPGDPMIPCLKLRGMWMHLAGYVVGTRFNIELVPEGILLTPYERPPATAVVRERRMGKREVVGMETVH